jgi:DNA polymerase III epsilon subunit-like protein
MIPDSNPPVNRVMLDLETLGHTPGSVIVSIGAVKFGGGKILDTFYHRIDAQSCVEHGLKMDVSTVE